MSPPQPASGSALELAAVIGDAITVHPLPARGSVTLGRGDGCDVVLDSRPISRRHALLHLDPPLRIEDLGSANGTFVRDTRSPADTAGTHKLRTLSRQSAEISIGERVQLGPVTIVVRSRAPLPSGGAVVRAPAMVEIFRQAARAARSTIAVLILGETGAGKEVLARHVHDQSPRAAGPYCEIHCAALPPSLLEGELFGYEKGAFTGAVQPRPGLLEAADGGTVFLDEVGELPKDVQVKLLRVLEDRKVTRLGGRTPRKLDVRFVAATNRDLRAESEAGAFRSDLYHRISGISFTVPPLRERAEEIAPLAEGFLAQASRNLGRAGPLRLSPRALRALEVYAWPGNVRELRNVVERAAVLCEGDEVSPADLPAHLHGGPDPDFERRRIVDALERCTWNQTKAARLLGISLRTLVNRLDRLGIPRPRK